MQPDFTPVKIFSIYPANAACTQIYHSLFSKRTASRPPQYIHTSENRQFYYLPRPAPKSRIIRPVRISKFPFAQFIRYIGICYFFDRPIVVKNKYRYILMLKFFRLYLFLLIPKMINRILFKFALFSIRQFCKVHFCRLLLS